MVVLVVGLWTAAAYFAVRGLQDLHDVAYVLVGAALLKSTFSIRMLHQAAARVRSGLAVDDMARARHGLRSLVSRDPSQLSAGAGRRGRGGVCLREHVRQHFGAIVVLRSFRASPAPSPTGAVNTLDSMVGYRGEYQFLGKVSARLDDLLNLIPARLTGLLVVLASSFLPGQRAAGAWRVMWRDHSRTSESQRRLAHERHGGCPGSGVGESGPLSVGRQHPLHRSPRHHPGHQVVVSGGRSGPGGGAGFGLYADCDSLDAVDHEPGEIEDGCVPGRPRT